MFQELPFYNVLIEKPRVKHVKNIDLLHVFPFYEKLSIVKISEAFKRYTRSYKVEIISTRLKRFLEATKLITEDMFKDFWMKLKALHKK